MGKSFIIGLLVVVLVAVLGFAALNNNSPATTENPIPVVVTNPSPTPAPASKAGTPIVFGDSTVIPSNSTAVVTGKVTPNGALTAYWYEYGETTGMTRTTSQQSMGSGYTSITAPAYITGLKANTLYYFRLSAQNTFGIVRGNMYSFKTNTSPPPSAVAPTTETNSATGVSRTTANLNGHVNPNSSQSTYWFEYGQTNDLGSVTALQGAGSGSASVAVAVSLSNLDPLTKYYFRLNAQNQYGTVNGTILSFTTSGPAAPGKPTADTTSATSVSTSTAALNGRLNTNGVDTDYWFEYSDDSLLGSVVGTVTASKTLAGDTSTISVKADISGLSRNTRYYFRLVAQNKYGTVNAEVVSFKTK